MKNNYLILLFLIFGLHLFLLFNLEFTAWPEILSFPYLKNNGFLLYKDMVHAYPPLLTLVLSYYFKLVGYGTAQLKVFTYAGILANDVLILFILRHLTKSLKTALLGVLFYAFIQPQLEGNMLWYDTVLTTPLLASFYLLILAYKSRFKDNLAIFLSGLFLGVSFLTKQTALAFFGVSFLFLLLRRVGPKKLIFFSLGPIALVGLLFLRLYQEGAISGFLNWTFYYPSTYWTKFPTYVDLSPGKRELAIIFLLLFPAIYLVFKVRKRIKGRLLLLLLFLLSGIVAVYPRFSFYHFQPALAFSLIGAGYALILSKRLFKVVIAATLGVALLSASFSLGSWGKEDRFFGKADRELARKIKEEEIEGRLYLLGLHSGLYVLSGKLPPKPWVDNFGWYFEIPGVNEWVLESWEKNPPEGIFWKAPEAGEWYKLGTYQPPKVTNFIKENYVKEEDITSEISFWRLKR